MPNGDYQPQCDEGDLNKARTQPIAGTQIALREARAEGYSIGRWAKDIPDLPTKKGKSSSQ